MTEHTTLRFTDEDRRLIEVIRARYGIGNATDAVRLALRITAQAQVVATDADEIARGYKDGPRPLPGVGRKRKGDQG